MAEQHPTTDKATSETKPAPADQLVVTQHTVTVDGRTIHYTVTTGTIVFKQESEKRGEQEGVSEGEKAKATFFFVAYTREDVTHPAGRPLTFSFNGGPGSSSVWLHLGVLGPRRVLMADDGAALPPPYRLVDNAYTLLDVTDLVFIDPVSTGYSRPVEGEKAKDFHGLKRDIESVGDFIRVYTTRYGRWTSPKFLIGESYGTTRAAGLSGYLQERHGLYLNGIMLISSILDFSTAEFDPGNDLPYLLYVPTYTATAWYHGRLAAELQTDLYATLAEAQAFALDEYALALLRGSALPDDARADTITKLARYTGLSEDYLDRCDLRIEIMRFTKELLRSEGRTVGRLDSRFKGLDRDSAGEHFEHDPSMSAILGPYTAALYDYVRRDLSFESDLPYEVLNGRIWPNWSYAEHQNRYVNVADTLRRAINMNPALKVFVANGYYDLATPYFATEYTINHLGLDSSLRGNITMAYYEAGHMMYIHLPSLVKLKEDLAAFVRAAIPA